MATIPTPTPASSTATEILQAILAGLQIAAAALPVIFQYKSIFGSHAAITTPIIAQAAQLHPVTGSIVTAALTPPPADVSAV